MDSPHGEGLRANLALDNARSHGLLRAGVVPTELGDDFTDVQRRVENCV